MSEDTKNIDKDMNLRKIVVVGATGRTGQQIVKKLRFLDNVSIICAVKDISKGRLIFGKESKQLSIIPCDITKDNPRKLASLVRDADTVIHCASYSPNGRLPDPFGALKVDLLGTKRLIDACADEDIRKFILISSLLTNGLAAGQVLNPQYVLLNSFGGILLCKYEAEKYLRGQVKLDYTIVRPGVLRDTSTSRVDNITTKKSAVLYGCADTLFQGSISRSLLADVVVGACTLPEASNKIVEVIESTKAKSVSLAEGFASVSSEYASLGY